MPQERGECERKLCDAHYSTGPAAAGSGPPCQQAAPPAPAPSTAATAAAPPAPPPPPPAPAAKARKVSESNDLYDFEYGYPAAAAAIPPLRDWLEADLAKAKADLISSAKDARAEAKGSDFPYNPYMMSSEWQVVTDLPGWLSLSAQNYDFSGGAHGNSGFQALLWDKAANNGSGQRRTALDLFTSGAALKAAVLKPFCAALDRQRAEKRKGEEPYEADDEFGKCIDPLEQVVILGSKSARGFDRIGFLIAPYNAGPYVEGSYEVTLPVTPAVLAVVKPEYRAAFVTP